MSENRLSRRHFLKHTCAGLSAAAMMSGFSRFRTISALAAEPRAAAADDYKALVCIFLFGGIDMNNVVIPYDNYADYVKVRPTNGIGIPQANLLQIQPPSANGLKYGFNPNLSPEVANPALATGLLPLWQQGKLAVLCNVGTLVQPITRSQFLSNNVAGARPDNLFSHSDQQEQWQSTVSANTKAAQLTGWGGRIADRTASLNGTNSFPMIVSTGGITLFTTGQTSMPLVPSTGLRGFSSNLNNDARYQAMRQLMTADRNMTLVKSASETMTSAIDNTALLNSATASGSVTTVFPNTSLGNQLKTVANAIKARSVLGVSRQIFFVSYGGWDTHNNEIGVHNNQLPQVAQAMYAFYKATEEIGVANDVTAFTLSDFSRTFQPASGGGTDHAWGSHHLILGGSVRGGDFYGRFPNLALSGPDDSSDEGRWIPTTSVDQYAATLAAWYGLSTSDMPLVFPNLGRFSTPNLGFLT
ncbi:MAG: DUF1501 domain-containing protein [Pyrinomonadaceae bacterium]|nr:DUF1501 domain-containing protein [Pyrinomonadaceae bacterium]